jgi:hypothetical protein
MMLCMKCGNIEKIIVRLDELNLLLQRGYKI